jgi:hypothetical protein
MNKRNRVCKDKYEGTIWSSNSFGDFQVLEYFNKGKVKISFIGTGYTTYTRMDKIRKGLVKDRLTPSVYGVGYIGDGPYASYLNGKVTKVYCIWHTILQRCYCFMYQENSPTYKDCTVIEEWHNFQNFAKWFEENYIEGYQIDKDVKVEGNKVYGPDTCMFVTPQKNTEAARAKYYKLVSPEGELVEVYNMDKFCRDNNLSLSCMYKVEDGTRNHHKGWIKYVEEVKNEE